MKRMLALLLALLLTAVLSACSPAPEPVIPPATESTTVPAAEPTTEPATAPATLPATEPSTAPVTEPAPASTEVHSELYIQDLSVEDVIRYFNEVVLDAEYTNEGDATLLQKWAAPVTYWIGGAPAEADLERIGDIVQTMNAIDGFPGFVEGESEWDSAMQIYFCTHQELIDRMGFGDDLDGAVTFWYNGENEIYSAIICLRNDIDQFLRNSVLLEEIYNGLGPIQDTALRDDSVIAQSYNEVQQMTAIDLLILRLLYHPDMKCGMTAAECEAVIRQLYF